MAQPQKLKEYRATERVQTQLNTIRHVHTISWKDRLLGALTKKSCPWHASCLSDYENVIFPTLYQTALETDKSLLFEFFFSR